MPDTSSFFISKKAGKLSNLANRFCAAAHSLGLWLHKNARSILFLFAVSALIFYPVWAGNLQNPDSRWIGDQYIADRWDFISMWESSQGRWALGGADVLRGGLNDSAVLTRLPALLFLAVGAQLAVDLLALRGLAARILAPLVLVLNPCVFEILTYRYCCASYGLSYLLAVAAVAAVVRLSGVLGVAVGACSLVFSMGLYQANLASAASLCLMLSLLALLDSPMQWTAVMRRLGRMLLMGVAALACYCAVTFANLAWQGEQLADYSGANSFGAGHILASLPTSWIRTFYDTGRFFLGHGIVANHYGMRPAYAAVLGLGVLACFALLWQKRRALGKKGAAALLIGGALLPPALNCMSLIIPENVGAPRTMLALLLVVPFVLALAERSTLPLPVGAPLLPVGCALACAVVLRGAILQIETDAMVMAERSKLYTTVAAQVYADLTEAENFGTVPVLVVGDLPNENFPDPAKLADCADTITLAGLSWQGSRPANLDCWQNLYREELGLALDWCTLVQAYAVQNSAAFAAMPSYPAAGSIATIPVEGEEILVCKVSQIGS